ncbi:COX15/CtaA family protein [soil metagenome]
MNFSLFQKWALATLVATLFLIFVGGFVRASGAGLGCPDWPRCWGLWLPPTSVADIDATLYDVSQFNLTKMWIEYLNRVVGVVVGLLVIGTFVLSLPYRRTRPAVTIGALAAVILVVFQGWLGGVVVRSGLAQGLITLHMVVAIALFCLLIWIAYRAAAGGAQFAVPGAHRRALRATAAVFFVLSAIQVVLGAEVREHVDLASRSGELPREHWIEVAGWRYLAHRTFAWPVVIGAAAIVVLAVRGRASGLALRLSFALAAAVMVQVVSGVAMAWFALPPPAQIVHLGVSTILCSLSFLLVVGLGERPVLLAAGGGGRDSKLIPGPS